MTYENLAIRLFDLLPSAPRMAHLIRADYNEEQGNMLLAAVIRQEIERLDNDNYGGEGSGRGSGDGDGSGSGNGSGNGSGDGYGYGNGAGTGVG